MEEGEKIGEQKGREKGKKERIQIMAFILKCSNQGDSREIILKKLRESFSVSQKDAETYYIETEKSMT